VAATDILNIESLPKSKFDNVKEFMLKISEVVDRTFILIKAEYAIILKKDKTGRNCFH
jgi:hypothetical protein